MCIHTRTHTDIFIQEIVNKLHRGCSRCYESDNEKTKLALIELTFLAAGVAVRKETLNGRLLFTAKIPSYGALSCSSFCSEPISDPYSFEGHY